MGAVPGSNHAIESRETRFRQDLSGDGTTGLGSEEPALALLYQTSPGAPAAWIACHTRNGVAGQWLITALDRQPSKAEVPPQSARPVR